jgi:acetyl-CoA carboxylase carboxyltransferase component
MDKVDKFAEFKRKSQHGGGKDKIKMQHNLHKMTARERILYLLDEGSFIELGTLVQENGGGVITGHGTINGRLAFVYSQDYTVDGGALTKENSTKICNIMDMAAKMGAPLIQIFDSVGGKLSQGLEILAGYGKMLSRNAKLSGVVPQISVIAGSCSGIAALNATMSDFTIMVKKSSELGINSSCKLIEKEKKYIDAHMHSGAESCSKNGSIQIEVNDDKEAVGMVRRIINYIPSNNLENAPIVEGAEELNVLNEKLNDMVNDDTIDIYEIINSIADYKSVIEINKDWESAIITSLVKINGLTVGIIGNNSGQDPELNMKACDKISRFVKMCDSFNIPLLSIVDTKGFVVSLEEEQNGLALYASKMIYALAGASTPKLALIVGKAYGAGYIAFASKETTFDVVYAWPSAKISLTEPKALIKALHEEEIVDDDNPKNKEKDVIQKYLNEVTDPYKAAEMGYIDDIIMPSETKPRIFAILDMLQSKRELNYPKKHGSTLV